MEQINGCGLRAAARYPDMLYWTYNWRKMGGSQRMYDIAKREEFYQQEYCGCVYSLRDTNIHRINRGGGRIDIGKKFYSFAEKERLEDALLQEKPLTTDGI